MNCLVSLVWNIVPGLVWLGFPTNVINIHCGLGYSTVPDTRWPGLIWSGLVQQVALRAFIAIDANADPTTMVKMQSSAMMYGMGIIKALIFNLISTTVFFM